LKKVLIITYYWPPSGGGGVQRWVKFVKYLREFGWEPVVFTPENPERPSFDNSLLKDIPENIQVIKNKIWEPFGIYKTLTGKKTSDKMQTAFLSEKKSKIGALENLFIWIRGNLFIPDARRFWIKPSVKYLSKFLSNNSIDVIVTTGPPHSAHMIGLFLKYKFNIPWLADFRDPWTNIDYYNELKLSKRADKIHHKLEKEVLKTANEVVVISPGMANEFSNIIPKDYKVIPNGYDADDINEYDSTEPKSGKFSLAHIGSLTKTRNPKNLWIALSQIVSEDANFASNLEIHNIGKLDINALESIKYYKLEKYLKQTDYMPHDEVVNEQQKATLLLLLVNDTPNAKLILTGKIFEYLVSGTPIICIAPTDGDAANVIRETSCGTSYGFDNILKLKEDLLNLYIKFKKGELVSDCNNIKKYERKHLTEKMSLLLDKISTSNV